MKNKYGQYFTPKHIAEYMVDMISKGKTSKILEPSAGEGIFLEVLSEKKFHNFIGIEIDPTIMQKNKENIINTSFVSWRTTEKFDVIIGNPPYIRWKNLDKNFQDELKSHDMWGSVLNSLSDYLNVFILNSIRLLSCEGELIFITPSFWMHTHYSAALREWMIENGSITEIIDLGENKVFENVSVPFIIFKYIKGIKVEKINYKRYISRTKINNKNATLKREYFEEYSIPSFYSNKHWSLASEEKQEVANVLEEKAKHKNCDLFGEENINRLGTYVDIANGMVSGLDRAFRFDENCKLTHYEKKALIRVAKAKDLGFIKNSSESKYINIPKGLKQKEVQEKYPNFWSQLSKYSSLLEKRYNYGKELPIWEWAFKRSELFFTSHDNKIFVPSKERMTNKKTARFSLILGNIVATQDVTGIIPKKNTKESIEYILAYLSTIQVSEWIRIRGLMKGGIAEFSEKPIKEIPFRAIDWTDEKEIEFHDSITRTVREFMSSDKNVEEFIENISNKFAEF